MERRGDYVRLRRRDGDPPEAPRIGEPHKLNLCQDDFRTVVCSKARWQAHPGLLEAHGLLLATRWVARCTSALNYSMQDLFTCSQDVQVALRVAFRSTFYVCLISLPLPVLV